MKKFFMTIVFVMLFASVSFGAEKEEKMKISSFLPLRLQQNVIF